MSRRRFVLIGHPVAHSVSPAIHQAAYVGLGITDCEYVAVDCPSEEAVRGQVEALRSGAIAGANVTVPWKRVALRLADEADPVAQAAGAANVLARRNGRVIACNTDIGALEAELAAGVRERSQAVVLGSGGAALASVVACRNLGISTTSVTARKWDPAIAQSEWPRAADFTRLGAVPAAWPFRDAPAGSAVLLEANLIVQATSAGMEGVGGGEALATGIPWDQLRPGVFVYDLVYNPPTTPLLAAARRAGVAHSGGLGMLVRQAALAIEHWLGEMPPLGPLQAAAERALFGEP